MDRSTPQQPEQTLVELSKDSTAEQLVLPAWHAPTITCIDIKRTMNSAGGSAGDFTTGHYV